MRVQGQHGLQPETSQNVEGGGVGGGRKTGRQGGMENRKFSLMECEGK